jgi:hypothetical protein
MIERKSQQRSDLAAATMEDKVRVLIRMQRMAREMARAAGRPFKGVVWQEKTTGNAAPRHLTAV